ncbi:MAG: elongation factor P hydroxylase [Pseudomonadales bacterium]
MRLEQAPQNATVTLPVTAIVAVFESCFLESHGTRCCGGAREPLYVPRSPAAHAQLSFRGDFAASALHEISHWCLAGERRRLLPDFGYHYVAAPRSAAAQVQFLQFEVLPQALESTFADAAGVSFSYSFDDVDDRFVQLRPGFQLAVDSAKQQLPRGYLQTLAGARARRFLQALAASR